MKARSLMPISSSLVKVWLDIRLLLPSNLFELANELGGAARDFFPVIGNRCFSVDITVL